jgi:exopolysaccharide production protein ExoY
MMRDRLLLNERTRARETFETKNAPPLGGETKRFIDIAFASCSLAFFLPLFGLIAFMIKLSDGGPIFYRHWRIGHARQPFECLKFRTMLMDGDEVLRQHLAASNSASLEWNQTRKLKRDPRVTTVGTVLRKLSLDELPQLINILRGDMSIVGPRPIVSDEVEMYGPHAELYFKARPGLTGLWQVSGRNDNSYKERVQLDCTYVSSWSLSSDLMIIMKTIPAVLSSRGSY